MTFRARYCASCARPVRRGTYLRCVLGCGAALCRKGDRCTQQHTPQCPKAPRTYTDSPGSQP
ncbi:hypothetical protein [Streptomyces wuyuanensis]|uniref:Uncharacterized protein n=1 Tax=Streptomyces wuyuanensis TaxID=1196353 RepID=A0A1H0EGI8_9ACTN|nr:hypothetical protein [Streptomyces wuyuanensis]SDN81472.1 hypothetical protein SAMN05444921_14412 [Streptomyces wuyuanensis]